MPRFIEDAGLPVKLHGLLTLWACAGACVRTPLTAVNLHMLHVYPAGPGTQVWVRYPIGGQERLCF